MATYKEACEAIAAFLNAHNPGANVTAKEVWEMSPTGEVWPVCDLYDRCIAHGMPKPEGAMNVATG